MLDLNEAARYEYRRLVQELYRHGYSIDIYSDHSFEYGRERVCIKMSYKKLYSYLVIDLKELIYMDGILLVLLEKLNHEVEEEQKRETNGVKNDKR